MAYVRVEIDLEEFDDDELVDELVGRGYDCTKNEPKMLNGMARVEHLAMCGMKSDALAELINITEQSLGISLH